MLHKKEKNPIASRQHLWVILTLKVNVNLVTGCDNCEDNE